MNLTREQWLSERRTGITGTGAAAIMGASPYMTNVEYWLEKTGQREPAVISDNEFVQYGSAAESHLIELFKLDYPKYQVSHRYFDLRKHDEISWLIGSLDGVLLNEAGEYGVLEIKTAVIYSAAQAMHWNNGIPMHHFWQVLHYLLVTGFLYVVLKAQLKREFDGVIRLDTRHYHFTRQEVQPQLDELFEKEIAFWQHVQNGTKPPLLLPRV